MPAKTLLTETEVLSLARANSRIPKCDLADIRAVEYRERRTCLGKDFYDALVADLVDYSAAAEYSAGTTYAADAVVLFQGVYYKAKVETSALPTTASDWAAAPKFSQTAYNDLWCEHLGRYLALQVVDHSVVPISTKLTAAGAIKVDGESFDAAKYEEVTRLTNWLSAQISIAFENLHDYLTENSSEGLFGAYAGQSKSSTAVDGDSDQACQKSAGWAIDYYVPVRRSTSTDCDEAEKWYCQ